MISRHVNVYHACLYESPVPIPGNTRDPYGQPLSLGIFKEGDFYVQEDLDLLFASFTSNVSVGTSPMPAFIDGAYTLVPLGEACREPELDFELAIPIIYPQNVT